MSTSNRPRPHARPSVPDTPSSPPGGSTDAAAAPIELPALIARLRQSHAHPLRESLLQMLARPEPSAEVWSALVAAYEAEPCTTSWGPKDVLANALAMLTDLQRLGDLVRLVVDERHGLSRALLLEALQRLGRADLVPVLEELARDPGLGHYARTALRVVSRRGGPESARLDDVAPRRQVARRQREASERD